MLLLECRNLQSLVRQIAEDHPEGLRHPEFVRKVLELGYKHREQRPLSTVVHDALKQLVNDGDLIRSENDYGMNEYHPAGVLVSI
jgi:hypothetical protein